MVVYDETGKKLHYSQYSALIRTGKYGFEMGNGEKLIKKMSPGILKYVKVDSTILNNLLLRWLAMADKIIVEKAKRKLYLERNGKIIFAFPVQLGNNPIGAKQKEGDGRTPEGLYYIDYNVNRDPAYYHGFHISYPNEKDIANARRLGIKPGGDIMIHGTGPDRVNRKDWTNGCIAVSNAHIDTLKKYTTNGISIEIRK
jgi:murein L,D-transpeptidase YafK